MPRIRQEVSEDLTVFLLLDRQKAPFNPLCPLDSPSQSSSGPVCASNNTRTSSSTNSKSRLSIPSTSSQWTTMLPKLKR